MKEKLMNFIKSHLFCTVGVIFLLLIILPPLLINAIYKVPAFWWLFKYEIPAGNLLSYWGTVLTFCATFSLSIVVYLQNKENIKNSKLTTYTAYIAIKEGTSIDIELPYSQETDMTDMSFNFKISALSKAAISKIYLDSIFFRYDELDVEMNGILMNFEEPKVIATNRLETEIDFKIVCFSISNDIVEFIKNNDEFGVSLNTRVKCNDVVTPILIFLDIKKQEDKCGIMKYSFVAIRTHASHDTSRIEE
jgi:hypothetical protein